MPTDNIVTCEFRMAFPAIITPEEHTNDDGSKSLKYVVTMLFPKGTDLKAMKDLAREARDERWPKADDPKRKNLRNPFVDGDTKDWDGYEGCTAVKALSKYKPGLVNAAAQPILDPAEVYGGCYARAQINAWAYDAKGNRGISFGLNHIQILRSGEPFGNRERAEDVFDAVAGSEKAENYDSEGDADDIF